MSENEQFIEVSEWQQTKEQNDLQTMRETLADLKGEVEELKTKTDKINEKVSSFLFKFLFPK